MPNPNCPESGGFTGSFVTKYNEVIELYNATKLKEWEAEAERMTAESFASAPVGSKVKIYTSNGDGTFSSTETDYYSAFHWANILDSKESNVASVAYISQLGTISGNDAAIVIVREKKRGGMFLFSSSLKDINDGCNIFNGWYRIGYTYAHIDFFEDGLVDKTGNKDTTNFFKILGTKIYISSGIYLVDLSELQGYKIIGNGTLKDINTGATFKIPETIVTSNYFTSYAASQIRMPKVNGLHDAVLRNSNAVGREEFNIFGAWRSFSTGSRGAGITLYGNKDRKHAGNIAFLTGQDNKGDARMIISGGSSNPESEGYRENEDTRITIGNNIYNFVDNKQDVGMLNLYNNYNNPAIYFSSTNKNSKELDFGTRQNGVFTFGEYVSGVANMYLKVSKNSIIGYTNMKNGFFGYYINNNVDFAFGRTSLDSHVKIKNYIGKCQIQLSDDGHIHIYPKYAKNLILHSIPNSDPNIAGAVWKDGDTLKISKG